MATPIYIIEEQKLRRNLKLIAEVAAKANIEVILAFKAFADIPHFSRIYSCYDRQFTFRGAFGFRGIWRASPYLFACLYR